MTTDCIWSHLGACLEKQNLQPPYLPISSADLLNHPLYFSTTSRLFISILKLKKHCSRISLVHANIKSHILRPYCFGLLQICLISITIILWFPSLSPLPRSSRMESITIPAMNVIENICTFLTVS